MLSLTRDAATTTRLGSLVPFSLHFPLPRLQHWDAIIAEMLLLLCCYWGCQRERLCGMFQQSLLTILGNVHLSSGTETGVVCVCVCVCLYKYMNVSVNVCVCPHFTGYRTAAKGTARPDLTFSVLCCLRTTAGLRAS